MFLIILLVWYFDIISLWTAFIIAIIVLACEECHLFLFQKIATNKIKEAEYEIQKLKDEINVSEYEIQKLKDEINVSEYEIQKLKAEINDSEDKIQKLKYTIYYLEEDKLKSD
ncbi:coiled-coil domain-containing protein [Bartonella taylorii]|uniref:coiled-coil domain-containing protein n=1 Tax=Bartonella taylorii TaxID=33046 RepID=UPI001ABA7EBD|nr:hypothetical protein [Bartonella taylorii]